jgi:hypothetical protein
MESYYNEGKGIIINEENVISLNSTEINEMG